MNEKLKKVSLWFLLLYSIAFIGWGIYDFGFKNKTTNRINKIEKTTTYNSEMILGHDTIFKQILIQMGHLNQEVDTIKFTLTKAK